MLGLVCVDLLILIIWTIADRPRESSYYFESGQVYVPVKFTVCSTGISSRYEQTMVAWKAVLLAAGVYKSICCWDLPSDIAEVS